MTVGLLSIIIVREWVSLIVPLNFAWKAGSLLAEVRGRLLNHAYPQSLVNYAVDKLLRIKPTCIKLRP